MNIILFDDHLRENLLPFTYVRPVSDIRMGIFTIAEKWRNWTGVEVSNLTVDYLQKKFPTTVQSDNLLINARILPDVNLLGRIRSLSIDEKLMLGDTLVAIWVKENEVNNFASNSWEDRTTVPLNINPVMIQHPWDIFLNNGQEIRKDYDWICIKNRSGNIRDKHTVVYSPENVFVEKGASIKAAILNAEEGPIYIGKNAVISEGAIIKGPFAVCENGIVGMGAKMRGDVTVGPYCKVGGEVSNSVIFGYSNKGHDGFMGNSVIGEWCNIGADSNTSNLKNNYSSVKVWSYVQKDMIDSGQTFCGLMMGDHSKCGINTMFNTGTITGVSCNIFDSGFPPKMIPSFTWGGSQDMKTFDFDKAIEASERMMSRRNEQLTEEDREILTQVFEKSRVYRDWEN